VRRKQDCRKYPEQLALYSERVGAPLPQYPRRLQHVRLLILIAKLSSCKPTHLQDATLGRRVVHKRLIAERKRLARVFPSLVVFDNVEVVAINGVVVENGIWSRIARLVSLYTAGMSAHLFLTRGRCHWRDRGN
jgi:hypothetical protein